MKKTIVTFNRTIESISMKNLSRILGVAIVLVLLNFSSMSQISGTYTIGPSGNYNSFTAAVSALGTNGVNGPVVFNVAAGTYSEQILLSSITGASSSNTITFQSATGDSTDVVLSFPSSSSSSNNYTLALDGADYITFKSMTIERTGVNDYSQVIRLSNGATHNQFINNRIIGRNYVSSSVNHALIYSTSSTTDGYNVINANLLKYGSYAILFEGTSGNYEYDNQIENNVIDSFGYYGVKFGYQKMMKLNGNVFNSHPGSGISYGIYSYHCHADMDIQNNQLDIQGSDTNYGVCTYYCDTGLTITGNKIYVHGTSAAYGIYSYYNDGTSAKPVLIANNFISQAGGTGMVCGIYPYNSNYVNIYFNSVNITGGDNTSARALYINSSSSGSYGNIKVNNNSFVNTGGGYAVEFSSNANTLGYVTACNYNNFYATGSVLALHGGTSVTSISAWNTASGFDANSISATPYYKSVTDLHIYGTSLNEAATPVSGLTTDIDGDLRNASTPDIGADEFDPLLNEVGITEITAIEQPACSGTYPIEVNIKNNGVNNLDSVRIKYEINNVFKDSVTVYPGIKTGQDTTMTVDFYTFTYGQNYEIKVYVAYPNGKIDEYRNNDTVVSGTFSFVLPPAQPIVQGDTVCIGGSATLYAKGTAYAFQWYDSAVGGKVLITDSILTTSALYADTSFYVESVNEPIFTSSIVITEVDLGSPNVLEIQNVSGIDVNTNGYKVLISDDNSNISNYNATVWSLPTVMVQDQVLYKDNNSSGSNYWGSNINWSSGNNGWALILDGNDQPVDFVAWGWGNIDIANMSVTYNNAVIAPANIWKGGGVGSICSNSIQRIGTEDNDESSDYTCQTKSSGTKNTSLTTPFPLDRYLCHSKRVKVDVLVLPQPEVNAGIDDSICFDTLFSTGNASAESYRITTWATSGDGMFADPGAVLTEYIPGINDIAAGYVKLYLSAEGVLSCAYDIDSMTLKILPIPTVDAGIDDTICETDTYALTGKVASANSVLWTTLGDGSFNDSSIVNAKYTPGASDISKGKVKLILLASSDCASKQDTVLIRIQQAPFLTAGDDDSICSNSIYNTMASAINYTNLAWTSLGDGSFSDANSLSTVYMPGAMDIDDKSVKLIIKVGAIAPCTIEKFDTIEVGIHEEPIVYAGSNITICATDTAFLSANIENYTNAVWSSSGDGTFSNFTIKNPIYIPGANDIVKGHVTLFLTVNPLIPCLNFITDSINVLIQNIPHLDAGLDDTICENATISLMLSASQYASINWSSSGGGIFDDPVGLNPTYMPDLSDISDGGVQLIVEATSLSPCSVEVYDTVSYKIVPMPMVDAGMDDTVCVGDPHTLKGVVSNTDSIVWLSTGDGVIDDSSQLTTSYQPGTQDIINGYIDLVLEAYGASACGLVYDTSRLYIGQYAMITGDTLADICENETYTTKVTVGNYTSIQWTTNGDGAFTDATAMTSDYTLGAIDIANGSVDLTVAAIGDAHCPSVSQDVHLGVKPLPVVNLGADTTIDAESSITLDAGAGYDQYDWSTGESSQSISVDSSGYGTGNATIWVEVTDDGCKGTDSIVISFKVNGIADEFGGVTFSIYPNPAKDHLNVWIDGNGNGAAFELLLINAQGQLVKRLDINMIDKKYLKTVDVSSLAKGMYFVRVSNGKQSAVRKIMIGSNEDQ